MAAVTRELDVSVVERDVTALLAQFPTAAGRPSCVSLASLPAPSTRLCEESFRFAHDSLDTVMFNHSVRVYYIGALVASDRFPGLRWDREAYYLTSVLHDLGVGPRNLPATRLSFEFHGGIIAREFLLSRGAPNTLADEVSEAIFRHTDFVPGKITSTGQLIQLATTLDVIGANPQLYHPESYAQIVEQWPRLGFNQHFAALMEEEERLKPGCHTTSLDDQGFISKIRANPWTRRFDE